MSSPAVEIVDTPVGVGAPPTLAGMAISAKSLTVKEQERVRAALAVAAKEHRPQRELARLLGCGQQTVSRALAGGAIGVKLAKRIADLSGRSLEELLEGRGPAATFGSLPGWHEAAAAAVELGWAREDAVAAVSRWPALFPVEEADARLVADLALLWVRWAASPHESGKIFVGKDPLAHGRQK